MPLSAAAVGLTTEPMKHRLDARWLMSYAAGLGDIDDVYLDTSSTTGIVGHPLFAICPEWPVALASRDLLKTCGLRDDEFRRGVHANHDSHVFRLFRANEEIITESKILSIEARKPGAFVTTCFDSRTPAGELVSRSFNGTLYRGVEIVRDNDGPVGANGTDIEVPQKPAIQGVNEAVDWNIDLPVSRNFAHVYTECARIYNPIHTDVAVAKSAGLPDFILHGSASLALAVSAIVRQFADGSPVKVRRISGEFRGMVLLPSTISLRCAVSAAGGSVRTIGFDVLNAEGGLVIGKGAIDVTT